ncbi:hypothetical protein [Nonomuraea aridisoli]|uniref:Uncharacterized protein n=1 Tax=Nonomuraea aridisoli TaxID=2070368 RepID=A0A2W2E1B0_9ACTN|nr:hypothetical protein [Nonomuraea aridisoli]PZG18016.1 hypothetical protein C1J01_16220 [Nonomuraea aridisoli]
MDRATLAAAARYFPLVGYARPAYPPLRDRVAEIAGIVEDAAQPGADRLHGGAHALNKAALLASDCGLPDLARDLCLQHIDIYRQGGRPLTAHEARYMLEPVHNLARLQIRADAGEPAMRLLDAMYRAAVHGTDLVVEGRTLPLTGVTGTREERYKLHEWAWRQYVADGIRTLTLAGRWDEAVTHAKAHRGIGDHLMEGRQAVIVAHCLRGATQAARDVLEESAITQPWERQVAGCLRALCADDTAESRHVRVMVDLFRSAKPAPDFMVFRARLGLTVATIAQSSDPDAAGRVRAQVAAEVIESGDGYAARDILRHPLAYEAHRDALAGIVASSGLRAGIIPAPLLDTLTCSAKTACELLTAALRRA